MKFFVVIAAFVAVAIANPLHKQAGFPVQPIQPSPVIFGPIPEGSPIPLVQIIVNVNQASESDTVPVAPVIVPEVIDPVIVVDDTPIPVDPVVIVEPEIPVPVAPVIVVNPVIPEPAITLPEPLN